jgi:DNA ligase (NAD+)
MDVRGLGPETVRALVSTERVRSVADLFALTRDDLSAVARFADVSASNLLNAIARARHVALWRFLHALGIPGVGVQTARDLAEHFGTLARIQGATVGALAAAPGVGPAAARQIHTFFRAPATRQVIAQCQRRGVRFTGQARPRQGALAGKTVVFTGALESVTRDEAEELARAHGAHTARTVGAGTDLVVAGGDPGAKFARARALGIRILDERQFRALVRAAS